MDKLDKKITWILIIVFIIVCVFAVIYFLSDSKNTKSSEKDSGETITISSGEVAKEEKLDEKQEEKSKTYTIYDKELNGFASEKGLKVLSRKEIEEYYGVGQDDDFYCFLAQSNEPDNFNEIFVAKTDSSETSDIMLLSVIARYDDLVKEDYSKSGDEGFINQENVIMKKRGNTVYLILTHFNDEVEKLIEDQMLNK